MNTLRYHESKPRGSPDFPLDYHFVDHTHNRYEMPYHWHDELEILHVIRGAFRLSIGSEVLRLTAGDVAFIASGLLHGGAPEHCEYECVVFDMRLLLKSNDACRQKISDVLEGRVALHPHLTAGDRGIHRAVLTMFDALRTQCEGYALITLGCLYQFVGEAYRCGAYTQGETPSGADQRRMLKLKQVFELIETRYAEPPTLVQLAASVGMTPKYFCRFFKAATHRTPADYVAYYRVEMACYAFAATDRNATEIALDMGFSDLNYFIRCFRKYKGVTPGRYRQMLRTAQRDHAPSDAADADIPPCSAPTM